MKRFISIALTIVAATLFSAVAHAQNVTNPASGVLRPPTDVTNIVSVEAHNILIIETEDAPDAPKQYSLIVPRHIYSTGIARLFGGTSIPTEMMISPGMAGRSGLAAPGTLTPMFNNGFNNNGFNNGNLNGGFPGNNLNQFPQTQFGTSIQNTQQPFLR